MNKFIILLALLMSILDSNGQNLDIYLNNGILKEKKDDYNGGILDFDIVIGINPTYAVAFYNRGKLRGRLKDYKGALIDFNKAIEYNSTARFL